MKGIEKLLKKYENDVDSLELGRGGLYSCKLKNGNSFKATTLAVVERCIKKLK